MARQWIKICIISFLFLNLFFKVNLGQRKHFFYSETTFTKQFCPNNFYFLCQAPGWNTKKLLKTKHLYKTSVKLAFNKNFFKVHFKPNQECLSKFWGHIFKTVLSQLFFMFSLLSSRMEQKKAIENQTTVYFFLHH